jgi:Domain of unknown function (DUF4142)
MKDMVRDHRRDGSDFRRESASAQNPDIRKFVTQTLPTLKEHRKLAQCVPLKERLKLRHTDSRQGMPLPIEAKPWLWCLVISQLALESHWAWEHPCSAAGAAKYQFAARLYLSLADHARWDCCSRRSLPGARQRSQSQRETEAS